MSNLFTAVPVEQQEIVAGGYGYPAFVKKLNIGKIFGGVIINVVKFKNNYGTIQFAGDDINNY